MLSFTVKSFGWFLRSKTEIWWKLPFCYVPKPTFPVELVHVRDPLIRSFNTVALKECQLQPEGHVNICSVSSWHVCLKISQAFDVWRTLERAKADRSKPQSSLYLCSHSVRTKLFVHIRTYRWNLRTTAFQYTLLADVSNALLPLSRKQGLFSQRSATLPQLIMIWTWFLCTIFYLVYRTVPWFRVLKCWCDYLKPASARQSRVVHSLHNGR